jgi:hypothetical protein
LVSKKKPTAFAGRRAENQRPITGHDEFLRNAD